MTEKYQSIHQSDVRRFKECRVAWDYASPLRRNLMTRRVPTYFMFGRLVHDALEQYYLGVKKVLTGYERAMIESLKDLQRNVPSMTGSIEMQELKDELEVGKHVVQHYMMWAAEHDDFEMVHPERKFKGLEIPDTDGIVCSGIFDGLIRRKDGSLWLKEFKTASVMPSDFSWLLLDEQASLYLWAANEMFDEPIRGILYTYLKKKAPTIPRRLKNGELSKASNMDTTVVVYYNALKFYGLDPKSYVPFLKFLAAKPNNFFMRYQVRRTKTELKVFMKRFAMVARQMADPDVAIYPTPWQQTCNRCGFFAACSVAASNPGMEEAILKTEYMPSVWR